jgi:hypothetical protein
MMQLLAAFERSFRMLAKQTGKVEWRGSVDHVNDLVPREARSADLVVIGRARDPADLFFSLDPGAAILRAGRPILFVPDGFSALAARRVGWPGRMSVRLGSQFVMQFRFCRMPTKSWS